MHLYIHVPFCTRRCSYCDFAIAVRRSIPAAEFADLVLREWAWHLAEGRWDEDAELVTVYLGGGTPSRLAPEAIGRLISGFARERKLAAGAEVTLEANPEDVTPEAAAAWRAGGVNRISLGVQSFDPKVLAWMHRVHDGDRPAEAVATLRRAGFDNVSLDLIYGLPQELARRWETDLDRALDLAPDHLSLYGLTVEQHTPLGRWVARGEVGPASDDQAADEYLLAHERLQAAGIHHYEVSNAARPGFESRHNRAYWSRSPFLGLGPSAHSEQGGTRWWNLREWEAYRRTMSAGGNPIEQREELTPSEIALEDQYLGLRTREGVAASSLPVSLVEEWVSAGWARRDGSRIVLTVEGWLRLDALVARTG